MVVNEIVQFILFLCTVVAFATSLTPIIYATNDTDKIHGVILLIIIEAVWLFMILPTIYFIRYKKVKDLDKRYIETKDDIYKIIDQISLEFCYFAKKERKYEKRKRVVEALSPTLIKFQFRKNGLYFLCNFDEKAIILKENHIKYYIDIIDKFLTYWEDYRCDNNTVYLIKLRSQLIDKMNKLYEIEQEMERWY